MLIRLSIQNIALIEKAEIEFTAGLNVLSGETGAGKSVIIDSFNFVLGAKADRTMIRHGQSSCAVTAEFLLDSNCKAREELLAQGIDEEDTLIIARRFHVDGKGDIRVNGTPVNATMLRKITAHLVDVHGQSEHFSLLNTSAQLAVVDAFGGVSIQELLSSYQETYHALLQVKRQLAGNTDAAQREIRMDVLRFQINEIQNADFYDGEEEDLLLRKEKIDNAERILRALSETEQSLFCDGGALDGVRFADRTIGAISDIGEEYSTVYDRIANCYEELNDICNELRALSADAEYDEEEAERVEERLDLLKKLKRKYGGTIAEIQIFLEDAQNEYETLENFERNNEKLLSLRETLSIELCKRAKLLTEKRKAVANDFATLVLQELVELSMPKAQFCVDFLQTESDDFVAKCTTNGADVIEFMFSANAGEPLKTMSKVISGGEMSRLMLAIKTQTSKLQKISTFVFDEIDAGISGVTAQTVAEKFAKIAKQTQIIAITHLPQISAMSDNGLLIEKVESNGVTRTYVHTLTDQTKTQEIVRLIGGNVEDIIAMAHAKNMIQKAIQYKSKL